ncbi:hypothetical protein [Sulfobacillus thermosulfidooxidans]|uniref:hypothetical protein n=1 Tax=Sulfobacillus thermosulfidooxidans TaxID=28034 RepID=UPI0006B56C17|nr:hypothetical protein [Sulfobacillus thermosulfidooxidans]
MNMIDASHLCNEALGDQTVYLPIDGRVCGFSGKAVTLNRVFVAPLSKTSDVISMEIRINGHETFYLSLRKITGNISEDGKDMGLHG